MRTGWPRRTTAGASRFSWVLRTHPSTVLALCALAALFGAAPLAAQTPIERVSQNAAGTGGEGRSDAPAVSADGRFVAFFSDAPNLVSGDTNQRRDVFVRDMLLDTIERVSVGFDGSQANGASQFSGFAPAIDADGRFVSFSSNASNLVPNDTNEREDVFVFDRQTRTTERISIGSAGEANGSSVSTDISADGRFVVFQSAASNLVEGDTNGAADIFLFDRETRELRRVSVASDGAQGNRFSITPAISADGAVVAFASEATNLVEGDTNDARDIFVFDVGSGVTARVSVSSSGAQANRINFLPDLNGNGQLVAFKSEADTLVPDDTNGVPDVFVHDRATGQTERVSVDSFGNQAIGGLSSGPSISGEGRYVAFASFASNLVLDDGNGFSDLFVFDRIDHLIRRISNEINNGRPGGNVPDFPPSISLDGRWVGFASAAENITPDDENNQTDVFLGCNPFDASDCQEAVATPTPTPECRENTDCDPGEVCVDGTCVEATPTPTPIGFCTSNDDCEPPQVCVDNMCVDPTPTPTPIGFCTSNDDCEPPQVCVDNMCVDPTPTPTPIGFCNSNDDCPDGQACIDHMCRPFTPTPTATPIGFCNSNEDCPDGQACIDHMCRPFTPTPTRTPIGFCTSEDDCPDGQACVDNMCRPFTPTASPTVSNGGGGGGGGCSCKIDPDAPMRGLPDALAIMFPALLLWLRRRSRFSVQP